MNTQSATHSPFLEAIMQDEGANQHLIVAGLAYTFSSGPDDAHRVLVTRRMLEAAAAFAASMVPEREQSTTSAREVDQEFRSESERNGRPREAVSRWICHCQDPPVLLATYDDTGRVNIRVRDRYWHCTGRVQTICPKCGRSHVLERPS